MADQELAEQAMQAALTTFESWKKWKPEHRANILFRAAAIIRRRKHEFSAYLVKEAGKPWKEADADTAEAIDFIEYYGRQMLRLKKARQFKAVMENLINITTFHLVWELSFHHLTSH